MNYYKAALLLCCLLLAQSCIKDEAPGAEADLEQIWFPAQGSQGLFFQPSDTVQTVPSGQTTVLFDIRRQAHPEQTLSALAPQLRLTPGATVQPASGSVQDFSHGPVAYTVTSQDGAWQRHYQVELREKTVTVSDTLHYDFERFALDETFHKFYEWQELNPDSTLYRCWATGNPGYKLAVSSARPEAYPTVPVPGLSGHAVELTTRATGKFGEMVKMRLAAGNLFLGVFDVQWALKDAMQATCFGLPFTKRPVRLQGVYQFSRGEVFQDRAGNPVEGKLDLPDIYGVMYRNHDAQGNPFVLHGDDVLTSPQIVALARIPDAKVCSEWTPFDLEFKYYEQLDPQLLAQRGYSLALVMSSSVDGAVFCGAIGSCLRVDNLVLICQTEE